MKKVSLAALAVALTSTAAMAADAPCPKAFQGFHLGGNIGYDVAKIKTRHNVAEADDDSQLFRANLGANGVDGGVGTGYTHRFGNFALGLAFDANWASTSGKNSMVSNDNGETENYNMKMRLQNSLDLYGKAGYVICEKTMPFIALGWENASWKHSFSKADSEDGSSVSGSKKKRLNGFLWKAGVDFLATRHVVLGIEYTGVAFGKHSYRMTNEDTGATCRASGKPQNNKFALTARVVY